MRFRGILRDTPTEATPAAGDGIAIPGEGATIDPDKREASNYEEKARSQGWRPETEFEGDSGNWVGAEEFVKRAPLFDKIKTQGKQLKELNKTVSAMATHFKKTVNAQVETRLAELKVQKTEAIELGQVATVEKIDSEIQEVQSQVEVETTPAATEIDSWVEKNEWFKDNNEMRTFAIAHNETYLKSNPDDLEKALKKTSEAVKKAYPDYFENPRRSEAPSVGDGKGDSPVGDGNGKYSMNQLSSEQKLVYNQHVKVHEILSHEEFFKGLEEIGELS
jgi:hypothetical protein